GGPRARGDEVVPAVTAGDLLPEAVGDHGQVDRGLLSGSGFEGDVESEPAKGVGRKGVEREPVAIGAGEVGQVEVAGDEGLLARTLLTTPGPVARGDLGRELPGSRGV